MKRADATSPPPRLCRSQGYTRLTLLPREGSAGCSNRRVLTSARAPVTWKAPWTRPAAPTHPVFWTHRSGWGLESALLTGFQVVVAGGPHCEDLNWKDTL